MALQKKKQQQISHLSGITSPVGDEGGGGGGAGRGLGAWQQIIHTFV